MKRILGNIVDYCKEHKVITAISGLILVLVILMIILMCMSGGTAPLAENTDSRYPYSISVTSKGLELNITGEFPSGYTWTGTSQNGDIISLSQSANSRRRASFLISPVATGSAQVRFYLHKDFIPELPDEIHEIIVQVYVDESGAVTLASHSDQEKKGLLGEDTDTFSYRVGEQPDGSLLVWVDNSKLNTTWTAYPSGSNVIVKEKEEEESLTEEEILERNTASAEEIREALEIAENDIKNQFEDGVVPEEYRSHDEEEEDREIIPTETADHFLYIVSYVKDGSTTVQIKPDNGENQGFVFSVMNGSDGKVAVTETHLYGQKVLMDAQGNPITDEEGNQILISESFEETFFDMGNTGILPGSMTTSVIPPSLQRLETRMDYRTAKLDEEVEITVEVERLNYTDSFGREWILSFTPYTDEETLVGTLTKTTGIQYDDVSIHGYTMDGKATVIWEQNYITYLLQAAGEEPSVNDAADQAQILIAELKEAE